MTSTIQNKFMGKRFLGVDYGRKFTGLAIFHHASDPYPLPFGRLGFKSDEQLILELATTCEEEFIDYIILGVPYFTDGKESTLTKEIKEFGQKLQAKLNSIEVFEQDETLTTNEAKERMRNSPRYNFEVNLKEIDALCASIILEDFLKTVK